MDEWKEGTLIATNSEQVNIENVMRDLGKTLHLDSFGQVHFDTSQKSSSGMSTSVVGTSKWHSQQTNTPVTCTSKGKETETSTQAIE